MTMSRSTMSIASSANSSSASTPFAAARTAWPSCSRRRRSSFRLTPSSSAMRIVGRHLRVDRDRAQRPGQPPARRLERQTGRVRLGSGGADMTELRSAVDNAVLGELRESVGDDPEFLAELVDDFLAGRPDPARVAARGRNLRRRSACQACGAHAEGQQPDVRSRRARVALPGGRGRSGGGRSRCGALSRRRRSTGSGVACAPSSSLSRDGRA